MLFERLIGSLVAIAATPLFTPNHPRCGRRPHRGHAEQGITVESRVVQAEDHPDSEAHKSSHKGRKSRHKHR